MSPDASLGRRPASTLPVTGFVASRGVTLLADQLVMFLVPVVLYLRTRSVVFSGAAFFVEWLPRTLSLPLSGAVVDARPLGRQLRLVDGLRAMCAVVLAVVDPPVALALLAGTMSMLNGYAMLLGEAVLARSVTGPAMAAAQGRMQVAAQLAQIAGPAAGAVALARWGFRAGCGIGVGLFAVGAVLTSAVFKVPEPDAPGQRLSAAMLRDRVARGLSLTFGLPAVRRLVVLTFLVNLVSGLALALLPALVTDVFAAGAGWVGVVVSTAAATSVVTAAAVTSRAAAAHLGQAVRAAGVVMAAAAFGMVWAPTVTAFAVAYAAWTGALTVYVVWMRTRRLALLPEDQVGAALGVFVAVILAAVPLSGLALALLGDVVGLRSLLLGTTVACLAGAVVVAKGVDAPHPEIATRRDA